MKLPPNNVSYLLKEKAIELPNAIAIQKPVRGTFNALCYKTLTFKQLDEEVDNLTFFLINQGIYPGSKVLLLVRPGYELIVISFSLFRLGAIPVIIDPGMGIKNFLNSVKTCKPHFLIGIPKAYIVSQLLPKAFKTVKKRLIVTASNVKKWIKRGREVQHQPARSLQFSNNHSLTSLAAIVFTSGSTGMPKGVCYTHQHFFNQLEFIRNNFDISEKEIDLPLLPIFALFNPALGMTTVVPEINPSRPATVDPKKIVDAIITCNVTNSFGSPTLWHKITDYCESFHIILPGIKRVFLAGTAVPSSLLARLIQILPNAKIYTPYGATECLPLTTIEAREILNQTWPLTLKGYGTCVGYPLPGVSIKIIEVNSSDSSFPNVVKVMPPNVVGEIIASGPIVTSSYYNNEKATQLSKIETNEALWHRMGDLGYLDDKGRLWFCGRKIERVEYAPEQYLYTDCIEQIFLQHPSINRCALIGLGKAPHQVPALVIQPIAAFYPLNRKQKSKFIDELSELAKQHAATAIIKYFFFEKTLPVDVRHNAKIHRLSLKRKYDVRLNNPEPVKVK